MGKENPGIFVIGYGNPGRLDDGLGPAFADAIEEMHLPGVTVDSNYQLTVEDAKTIAEHDTVIFADADISGPEPFSFRRIEAKPATSFTSHIVEPETVLALAHGLFGASTRGYILGIRGYDFNEFGEELSRGARTNLVMALRFIKPVLLKGLIDKIEVEIDKSSVTHTAYITNGDE